MKYRTLFRLLMPIGPTTKWSLRSVRYPQRMAVVVLELVAFVAGLAPGGYSFT